MISFCMVSLGDKLRNTSKQPVARLSYASLKTQWEMTLRPPRCRHLLLSTLHQKIFPLALVLMIRLLLRNHLRLVI